MEQVLEPAYGYSGRSFRFGFAEFLILHCIFNYVVVVFKTWPNSVSLADLDLTV